MNKLIAQTVGAATKVAESNWLAGAAAITVGVVVAYRSVKFCAHVVDAVFDTMERKVDNAFENR